MNAVRGSMSVFRPVLPIRCGARRLRHSRADGGHFCRAGKQRRTLASAGWPPFFVAVVGPKQWWE